MPVLSCGLQGRDIFCFDSNVRIWRTISIETGHIYLYVPHFLCLLPCNSHRNQIINGPINAEGTSFTDLQKSHRQRSLFDASEIRYEVSTSLIGSVRQQIYGCELQTLFNSWETIRICSSRSDILPETTGDVIINSQMTSSYSNFHCRIFMTKLIKLTIWSKTKFPPEIAIDVKQV